MQLIGLWVVHIGPNLRCYKVKKNEGGASAPTRLIISFPPTVLPDVQLKKISYQLLKRERKPEHWYIQTEGFPTLVLRPGLDCKFFQL
jgi:hypothetical protein